LEVTKENPDPLSTLFAHASSRDPDARSTPMSTPKQESEKITGSVPSCPRCDKTPTTVIDDDIGLDDESHTIVIVGGGVHALAALSALHEGSLSFEHFMDDGQFQARVGFNSHEKIGTVCVIDPGSHFMESWNLRFDNLEIKHLRSPAFAHPVAFEPSALLNFAVREGRAAELNNAPLGVKWLASIQLQEPLLKALPSNALFRDFCASLEKKLPHRWLSGTATSVCKDSSTGKFRVHYQASADQRERKVVARAVILATGPSSKWNVPVPFEPHLSSRLVLHTEELLAGSNGTLREEIMRRCPARQGGPRRVLVLGGGISAAQAALAVHHAGHQVTLRSRRSLQTRAFDIASEWLDVRHADRLRFEFWSLPMEERLKAVREAISGGSVPAKYMQELQAISSESSALCLEVDAEIDRSQVCVDGGGEHIVVNGESFAMVILATGTATLPMCTPIYRSVQEMFDAPTVSGLPQVDNFLRWVPDEDVFVLGANAVLELGPGGGNVMGAMRGAKIVSHELHHLMFKKKDEGKAQRNFANAFAGLMMEDGIESDEESTSEEEDEASKEARATAISAPPPAAKKLSKAEMKLKNAKKARRASKGGRGRTGTR
jgi:hypothetical protein